MHRRATSRVIEAAELTTYGIFCFLGRGHLDPAIALGRALLSRGHRVTLFHLSIAQVAIRRANLRFFPLDKNELLSIDVSKDRQRHSHPWASTLEAIQTHASRTLREAPQALTSEKIDVVISDQLDVAAASVAEATRLPHISISCSPPIYLDDTIPPPYFDWVPESDQQGQHKNKRANAILARSARPIIAAINDWRSERKLQPLRTINDLFSNIAIITQLPTMLELPRRIPPHLFYAAQFRDDSLDERIQFDWARLSGKPVVYASLGTVRNTSVESFRMIALACSRFDIQLVLSLGGGQLLPSDLGHLPGSPVISHYVPQRKLLRQAVLAINCAGLNTTLECLRNGVPIVAIPIGEDQPGVAARITQANVGITVPSRKLTINVLEDAISRVLQESTYRASAECIGSQLQQIDGLNKAVSLIEKIV